MEASSSGAEYARKYDAFGCQMNKTVHVECSLHRQRVVRLGLFNGRWYGK